MYCVIQEIELKKPNKFGHYKELKSTSTTFTIDGVTKTNYSFSYSGERFERPIKKAYKISIHESKRVSGVVTKKQYAVTTASYYDLLDYWIGDCLLESRLRVIADKLETNLEHLWDLINAKVDPLQERIKAEFKKTEEYKTRTKHDKIIKAYNKAKAKFAKDYDCDSSEYDYCYNVFGELMNKKYINKVVAEYNQKCSYQRRSYSNYKNYDWSGFNSSGNHGLSGTGYSDTEKELLKKFYRTLAKEYHPDNTRGGAEEMQLVNKVKESWGI